MDRRDFPDRAEAHPAVGRLYKGQLKRRWYTFSTTAFDSNLCIGLQPGRCAWVPRQKTAGSVQNPLRGLSLKIRPPVRPLPVLGPSRIPAFGSVL